MLAGYNTQQTSVTLGLGSVLSGTTSLPVLQAPFGGLTITSAYLVADDTINAGTVNYATFTLLNGGLIGTATTAIGTAGGTVALTALTPLAATINTAADELTAGQWLVAKGVMTGAIADNQFQLIVNWVRGKG
jgi:hypothetical protein